MYKVTSNTPFTGYGYSLAFDKGVAYTDDQELAEYLVGKGYTVEQEQKQPTRSAKK